MAGGRTPLILALDVEPGPHHVVEGTREEWDGFDECAGRLGEWRREIALRTGHRPRITWSVRMDPQIEEAYGSLTWALETFKSLIGDLLAEDDEFGLHPHPYRWNRAQKIWSQHLEDSRWLNSSLRGWMEAFRKSLGFTPDFFRFGDHWLSEAIVDFLEREGVGFELTVEPGRPLSASVWPDVGQYVDYTQAPRRPYYPFRNNFLRPGHVHRRKICIVPLTTACIGDPSRWHINDHEGHQIEAVNLSFDPAWMRPLMDEALNRTGLVTVVGRTGDLSNAQLPHLRDWFWTNWEYLWSHPSIDRFAVETPRAAIARYQANGHEL